jgi:poly(3-hydroxybutyrate) depolymerase
MRHLCCATSALAILSACYGCGQADGGGEPSADDAAIAEGLATSTADGNAPAGDVVPNATEATAPSSDDEATADAPAPEQAGAPTAPEPAASVEEPLAEEPPAEEPSAEEPSAEEPGVPSAPPTGSPGCSGSATPPSGAQTIDVSGTARTYIVSLPEDYDPESPYPLVFAYHGLGGSGAQASGSFYLGIEQTGGTRAVFVYPDGLDGGDGAGWPNTDGRDVAFFDAMLNAMQTSYCIDSEHVFSTGHSYGGMMSHTLGCERADVLRGIAPVAGAHFGRADCGGPIAAWGAHGNPDDTVSYESGLSAMARVLEANGCDSASSTAVEPTDSCILYECDAGFPVTWCEHDEGHGWPAFAARSIKQFIDSF